MDTHLKACPWLQGVYAPSEIDSNIVISYEDRLVNLTRNIYSQANTTLYAYQHPAQAGLMPRLSASDWAYLNK